MGFTGEYDEETMARAYGKELKISPKHSLEICREIRGMDVNKALDLMDDVIAKRKHIPFKKYNKLVPHRKGGAAGRFPEKACKEITKVIESAMANATFKELDPDEMMISTSAACKGRVIKGWMQRAQGRATPWNEETTNVEIILRSMED